MSRLWLSVYSEQMTFLFSLLLNTSDKMLELFINSNSHCNHSFGYIILLLTSQDSFLQIFSTGPPFSDIGSLEFQTEQTL